MGIRALPGSQVVHVGLKVLDRARLVCGREVRARVGERQCTDGGIVCLKNRLEVECQAVPERKLATGRSSKHPPAFGRPLFHVSRGLLYLENAAAYCNDVHWTSNFIR